MKLNYEYMHSCYVLPYLYSTTDFGFKVMVKV